MVAAGAFMRTLVIIVAILALIGATLFFALAPKSPGGGAAPCAESAEHAAAFSDPQAPDTLHAVSQGAPCAAATVRLVLRNAAGAELWRYEASYLDMAFGGPRPEGAPKVAPEEMRAFLARWADATVSRASALPDWPAGAARLALVRGRALVTDTPLAREAYEALRAADAPTLCYAASMDVSHCLVFDAATHKARLVAALGPSGADLRMSR
jgi:hypothetical protein